MRTVLNSCRHAGVLGFTVQAPASTVPSSHAVQLHAEGEGWDSRRHAGLPGPRKLSRRPALWMLLGSVARRSRQACAAAALSLLASEACAWRQGCPSPCM